MASLYPNPLWQSRTITASSSATEYSIYQSPVGDYGLFVSFVFTENDVLADEIHIRITFNDNSQFTDVFSNDVKQKVYNFRNESRGTIKQVYLYYTEISSLNVSSKIEWIFSYDYWGETAHTQYQTAKGSVVNNLVFIPYHTGIRKCQILKRSTGTYNGQTYASIVVYVTDRLGITRTSPIFTIYHSSKYLVVENWGEVNFYEAGCLDRLPNGTMLEVNVETRMDSAAITCGFFPPDSILTDRWFPSYNGITPEENGNEALVDNKEVFFGYPSAQVYVGLPLDKVINNTSRTINAGDVSTEGTLANHFKKAIDGGYRIGLLISPSTLPFVRSNCYISSGENIYYAFPTWMLNDLNQSLSPGECARYYVVQKTDTYTGASIKIVYLNWANATTRQLYKDCIDIIYSYLYTTYISGKRIYKYIDYIKVGFAGTWGEGLSLDMSGTSLTYPSYANLQEISDYILGKFTDKPALLSLGTAFNSEFPREYRDYVINGNNGFFYDGADNVSRFHYLKVGSTNPNLSLCTPEMMNKASLYSREHLTYVECTNTQSNNVKPSYADLEAYAKYYSPDYLSIKNIFFNDREADYNLKSTIRRISRYVGTRPYIGLKEFDKVFTNGNLTGLKVRFSIGNYGTAMFRSFWKLMFYLQIKYVGSTQMTEQALTIQQLNSGNDFLLTSVPKPFEPGVPCFYDTKLISGTYNIPITGSQVVDCLNLLVEIVDEDGICNNLLFCNSEESLPREKDTNENMTGRFYLFQYAR